MTLRRFPILVDETAQLGVQNSCFEMVFKSHCCKQSLLELTKKRGVQNSRFEMVFLNSIAVSKACSN